MPDLHLYEYAVIRIVPRVEREEFLNTGVVLYCRSKKFLGVKYEVSASRLVALDPLADRECIKAYLSAFSQICQGAKGSGTIGCLPMADRFRWLTATRSTVVQASKVHPGLCADPSEKLEDLFRELVL